MRKLLILLILTVVFLTGCTNGADYVYNLSKGVSYFDVTISYDADSKQLTLSNENFKTILNKISKDEFESLNPQGHYNVYKHASNQYYFIEIDPFFGTPKK